MNTKRPAAPTTSQPATDRRRRRAGGVLLRRGWVVALAAVATGLIAALIATANPPMYASRAVFVVPAVTDADVAPGRPDQAARLASTYAIVIPADDVLVGAVAEEVGLSADRVRERTTVTNEDATGVIYVLAEAPTESGAVALAQAWDNALTGSEGTGQVAAGSVLAVSVPQAASEQSGVQPVPAGIVGALVGALIGGLGLWAWSRSRSRLETADDVTESLAVFAMSGPPGDFPAMAQVSSRIHAGRPGPAARLGLLPTESLDTAVLDRLVEQPGLTGLTVGIARGAGASPQAAQRLVDSDAIIVVAPVGAQQAEVRHAIDLVSSLGRDVSAVYLVDREGS